MERLAVFVSYIQSSFRICVQNCFPVSQDSFWVQLRVCFGGNATPGELAIELGLPPCWILVALFLGNVSSRCFSKRFLPSRSYAGPRFLWHKAIHDHAEFVWALRLYITA